MISWLVALAVFGLCVAGAAPGLHWFDSGELVAGAWHLGVSHPPGQPAWTLLAKAASFLPFGSVPFRMTLLSAGAVAASVALAHRLGRRLWGQTPTPACGFFVLLTATHPFVTAQAIRPEVYAPALALLLLAITATLDSADGHEPTAAAPRSVGVASLATGVLLAIHPLVGGVAAAAGVAWLLGVLRPARGAALLIRGAPLLVLGLMAYALLPIRTAAGAAFAWGNPDSLGRFLDVATAAAYRGNFAGAGAAAPLMDRIAAHASLLWEALGPVISILAVAGLAGGLRRRPLPTLLLVGVSLAVLGTSISQRVLLRENPDVHGYLAPVIVMAAIPAAAAVKRLWQGLGERPAPRFLAAPALVAFGALPALAAPGAISAAGEHLPRLLARTALDDLPPFGALVSSSDHIAFGSLELRSVEGARPDAAVGIRSLFTSSWHLRDLKRDAPQRFIPYIDDGRADHTLARFLDRSDCAAGVDGTCLVEDPALLPEGGRPGARRRLLYDPSCSGDRPGDETAALARLSGSPPTDRFLRFHAKARARHLAAQGLLDDAITVVLGALGSAEGRVGPPSSPELPMQYGTIPPLEPVMVSDRRDLEVLLADLLAASGRPLGAARLWDSPRGRASPRMGVLAVHHLFNGGEPKAAREAYLRVLDAYPGHRIEILYNLGVFFARQGEAEAARVQFATLLNEAPAHSLAHLARRYLARLESQGPP